MPFVNVHTVKGMLTDAQKRELEDRITDLMVEVEGRGDPAFRRLVWVKIDEAEPAGWSMGGTHVTPELVARVTSHGRPPG
jgi:4-oxalocrotonate tautomerase